LRKLDSSGAQVTDWHLHGAVTNAIDMGRWTVRAACTSWTPAGSADLIQKYDSAGTFIAEWDADAGVAGEVALGMDVDPAGNVYVVESNARRVAKFTSSGTFLGAWGARRKRGR